MREGGNSTRIFFFELMKVTCCSVPELSGWNSTRQIFFLCAVAPMTPIWIFGKMKSFTADPAVLFNYYDVTIYFKKTYALQCCQFPELIPTFGTFLEIIEIPGISSYFRNFSSFPRTFRGSSTILPIMWSNLTIIETKSGRISEFLPGTFEEWKVISELAVIGINSGDPGIFSKSFKFPEFLAIIAIFRRFLGLLGVIDNFTDSVIKFDDHWNYIRAYFGVLPRHFWRIESLLGTCGNLN